MHFIPLSCSALPLIKYNQSSMNVDVFFYFPVWLC